MDNQKLLEITKKKRDELKNTINDFESNSTDSNLDDVKEKTYVFILFVGMCIEKCRNKINNLSEKDYTSGFTFVNNVLKHSNSPFDIEFLNNKKSAIIGQSVLGIGRIGMGPALEWNTLPLDDPNRNGLQYSQFNNHLLKTEISSSADKIIKIIEKYL